MEASEVRILTMLIVVQHIVENVVDKDVKIDQVVQQTAVLKVLRKIVNTPKLLHV